MKGLTSEIKKFMWAALGCSLMTIWLGNLSYAASPTTIQFSTSPYRVFESNGGGLAIVIRSGDLSQPSSVSYYATNGTATAPADYSLAPGVLTFDPGDTMKYIPITVVNDHIVEPLEDFQVHLTSPTGANLGNPKDATMYIVDGTSNTLSTSTVHFESVEGYGVREVDHVAYIAVDRDGDLSGSASVNFNTTDGSATSPADYAATSGILTFNPGENRKIFSVPIVEDAIIEPLETIALHLSNPTGTFLGNPKDSTLYVTDTSSITLSSTTLHFDTTSYSVYEAQGVASIKVDRDGDLSGVTYVDFFTSDGSATNPTDYTFTTVAVKFNPGESQKIVQVPIASDNIFEPTETVGLHLTPLSGGRVVDPKDATLFIIDSTTVSFSSATLHFSTTAYYVAEAQRVATITIIRDGDLTGLSYVEYNTTDGTAKTPVDYGSTEGQLKFNPGESQKTFTVPIVQDSVVEPTETVGLHLSFPFGAALTSPKDATLFIIDSTTVTYSTTTTVHFQSALTNVAEAQRVATIKVVREGDLRGITTVNFNTTDGTATSPADFAATSGMLTFNPNESEKTFNVTIVMDGRLESTETAGLHLSNALGAILVQPKDAILEIEDSTIHRAPNFEGVIQPGTKTYSSVRSGEEPKLVLDLADAGDLEISVFDRTGRREIKSIHRAAMSSGEMTVSDMNLNLPFGVYRLKIKLNGRLIKETPLVLVP